jgi:DNA-binding transcriptional ArsR family regulator
MVAKSSLQRYEQHTEVLRAIAHPIRLAVIELLYRHHSLSVSQIHESLRIEQATASHHLKILRQAGILKVQREGRYSYYLLADDSYPQILHLLG